MVYETRRDTEKFEIMKNPGVKLVGMMMIFALMFSSQKGYAQVLLVFQDKNADRFSRLFTILN
jgi:hypothetical protein